MYVGMSRVRRARDVHLHVPPGSGPRLLLAKSRPDVRCLAASLLLARAAGLAGLQFLQVEQMQLAGKIVDAVFSFSRIDIMQS